MVDIKSNQIPKSKHHRNLMVMFALLFVIFGGYLFYRAHNDRSKVQEFSTTRPVEAKPYSLPASKPVGIKIAAIGVDAKITELGLNPNHTLEVPKSYSQVGWYRDFPTPGEIGPAILVGHLDSATSPAVFWKLKDLKPNDRIEITREDGTTAIFQVDAMKSVEQNNFPTEMVYGKTDNSQIRLITCQGKYSVLEGHYDHNLVVFASLVK